MRIILAIMIFASLPTGKAPYPMCGYDMSYCSSYDRKFCARYGAGEMIEQWQDMLAEERSMGRIH